MDDHWRDQICATCEKGPLLHSIRHRVRGGREEQRACRDIRLHNSECYISGIIGYVCLQTVNPSSQCHPQVQSHRTRMHLKQSNQHHHTRYRAVARKISKHVTPLH